MNKNDIDSLSLKEQIEINLHETLCINGCKLKDIAYTDFCANIIKQGELVALNNITLLADKKQIFTFRLPMLKSSIDNKYWLLSQTKDISKRHFLLSNEKNMLILKFVIIYGIDSV